VCCACDVFVCMRVNLSMDDTDIAVVSGWLTALMSGCLFSGYDAEAGSHPTLSAARVNAERLLCDASAFDAQLQNLVSRRVHSAEGIQHLMSLRCSL